ncbi:MAG: hypothetical protein I3273_04055 [Candidatus Moeniiplasma glomeromycotorum]|nr:hypothetical protein [Candidatus Moeniiplasma glomeromycotorum]
MNENNATIQKEEGINREFFQQIIENSNLSEEDKKKIGEFKEFKNDKVGEILKVGDEDKIKAYERLNVKDLPEDWKFKLERLKHLERLLAENEPKIAELKEWKEVFGEKKPLEIQGEIKKTAEENNKIKEELKEEKEKHNLTEQELKNWEGIFPNQNPILVKEKIKELEEKVKEWTQFFDYRELEEIKKEIEELRKRPDISISENDFYDDYAKRKSIRQSELDREELEKEKQKVIELSQERERFLQAANYVLEIIKKRRYALDKPVATTEQAQEAIAELLEETLLKWENYSQGDTSDQELTLELSIYPDKKVWVQQVLEWIREAQGSKDYKKLFERWNDGFGYNKEKVLGGSLSLLRRYLEVKDPEQIL